MKNKILFLLFFGLFVVMVSLFFAVRPVGGRMIHGKARPTPNGVLTALPDLTSQLSFYDQLCASGPIYTSMPTKCLSVNGLQPVNVSEAGPQVILIPTPNR